MQARPSWHARTTPTALLPAVLAALCVLALLLTTGPAAAVAGTPAAGIGITPAGYGPVQLGPLPGTSGSEEHGYCVQARVTPSGPADVPVAVDAVDDAPLAAVLARHRFSGDDTTQAAISYLAHMRHERPGSMAGGDVDAARRLLDAATPSVVRVRADELLATAEREAGPWQGGAGTVTGAGRRTGEIRGIELRSAAGDRVVGSSFTVTLSGPAVLDATGTRTYSGTTAAEALTLAWTATGNGLVTYDVRFPDAWRTTVTILTVGGNRQDQLTYGNRPGHDPREIVVPGPEFPVVRDFRPRATTSVQDVGVQDGDPLVDVVSFSAAPGDEWAVLDGVPVPVPADVTWYGPFDRPQPQQAQPPAGAPVAGVERIVAHGPGTVTTAGTVTATGRGFYTAVVTIRKAEAGPYAEFVREDFTAPWFEETETAVNRFRLEHESQTRDFNVVPGGRAFDRVVVRGYPDDHGGFTGLGGWQPDLGDATVTVYGPLPEPPRTPEVPDDAPVYWTDVLPAVDGVHEVGYDPDHPVLAPTLATHRGGDYFVFVYAFDGDDRVEPFVSRYDDVREVFFVPGEPEVTIPPSVVTEAQPDAVAGQPVHDLALVTGTTAEGDHLVFDAYGPLHPDEPPVCDETTRYWTSDVVPVVGPGRYGSGETAAPDEPGHLSWVETLHAADGTVLHRGPCGVPWETTVVHEAPMVRTTALAAEDDPVAGVEIWDVLRVTGTMPTGAVAVVDLFHAEPGDDLVCTEPVWTSAPVRLASGPGEYVSERFTTTGPGSWGFVERTTAPDGTTVSTGECGDPAETLTVGAPPVEPVEAPPAEVPPADAVPLAVTGADALRAALASFVLLGVGVGLLAHRAARARRAGAGALHPTTPADDPVRRG